MTDNVLEMKKSMTIVRDTRSADTPELWLEVCIVGDQYEIGNFAEMLVPARCTRVELPEDADVVIFTGGQDVNPALYGQEPHASVQWDEERDAADIDVYTQCIDEGIPMFGVCRGAQFLHVMNGGRLYQDINNHNGDHSMYDLKGRKLIEKVSSVHHQACIANPEGGMEVIATSSKADFRWLTPTQSLAGCRPDVEAYFYRDTCCFGVQGHPEYRGYSEFAKWTMHRMNEFFLENPDLALKGRVRRIKDSVLDARNEHWAEIAAKTMVIDDAVVIENKQETK